MRAFTADLFTSQHPGEPVGPTTSKARIPVTYPTIRLRSSPPPVSGAPTSSILGLGPNGYPYVVEFIVVAQLLRERPIQRRATDPQLGSDLRG